MSDGKRVLVCVPSVDHRMTTKLGEFLVHQALLGAAGKAKHAVFPQFMNAVKPVEYARNLMAWWFLKEGKAYTHLWFIDADMTPEPNLVNLLDVDADIVGGRCHILDEGNNDGIPGLKLSVFEYIEEEKLHRTTGQPMHDQPQVQDVDAMGTATLLIARRVLEDERMWADTRYRDYHGNPKDLGKERRGDDWAPPLFRVSYKPNGRRIHGEDVDFCFRAKKLGYSIKCHFGARAGHRKDVDLDFIDETTRRTVFDAAAEWAKKMKVPA